MEENKRNKKIRKVIKRAKGVTMLALVVTIIVLLILAAITLSLAVGENGIIKRAKLARDKAKNASIAEEEAMNLAAGEIDNAGSGGSGPGEGGTCPECPDVSELENTIKELQNTIASLEQQLAAEKANKAELERQIASLNNQIARLNNELNSKKEQIADLQGQLASKNEEIARKDETIRNLQETVDRLNTQIEELNRQIETLKTKQATGNAAVSEVLAGKTFSNSNGVGLVGTMANNGAISQTLNAGESYTVPAGYHNGSGRVTAASLASQTSGTAGAGDILTGKTAWVNGTKLTGTNKGYEQGYTDGQNAGTSKRVKLGSCSSSATFSVKDYEGWQNYTAENFALVVTGISMHGGYWNQVTTTNQAPSITYDANAGTVTVKSARGSQGVHVQNDADTTVQADVVCDVYLYY